MGEIHGRGNDLGNDLDNPRFFGGILKVICTNIDQGGEFVIPFNHRSHIQPTIYTVTTLYNPYITDLLTGMPQMFSSPRFAQPMARGRSRKRKTPISHLPCLGDPC